MQKSLLFLRHNPILGDGFRRCNKPPKKDIFIQNLNKGEITQGRLVVLGGFTVKISMRQGENEARYCSDYDAELTMRRH